MKLFPERGIHATAGFTVLLAVALLFGAWQVTSGMLLAACLHECGHLLLLAAFGIPVYGVRLGAFGAVIHAPAARRLSYGRELLVTLAGPAINLILAPLAARLASRWAWEWGYLFAGANLLLGVYNLLPIPPLDGGRALYLLCAYCFGVGAGERTAAAVGLCCALALTALGAYLTLRRGGALFLLAALGLLAEFIRAQNGFAPRG